MLRLTQKRKDNAFLDAVKILDIQEQSFQPYSLLTGRLKDGVINEWNQWECHIEETILKEIDATTSFKVKEDKSFDTHDGNRLFSDIQESKLINPYYILSKLDESLKKSFPHSLPMNREGCFFPTSAFVSHVWHNLLCCWHNSFKEHLFDSLTEKFQRKLEICKGFYNFTDKEVPQHIVDILKQGERYIPHIKVTMEETKKQFVEYTYNFMHWALKNIEGEYHPLTEITEDKVAECLQTVLGKASPVTRPFWTYILERFQKFMSTFNTEVHDSLPQDENGQEHFFIDHEMLHRAAIPDGTILMIADKHFGLVLLRVEDMVRGQENVLLSLGAKLFKEMSQPQLVMQIICKYSVLRTMIPRHLKKVLDDPQPTHDQQMPFLKLMPKIHKMTADQIARKETESMKFRPICDSQFAPTKPAAQAAALLMVRIKHLVTFKFPQMEHYYPKSGHEVSLTARTTEFPTYKPYSLMVSCDLSDAYSNCNLDDLIQCSRFLSAVVENDPEEQTMLELLSTFVLTNNYIECGGQIFSLDPVLPMGCCLSGEALDIIAMAGEVLVLVNPPINDKALSLIPAYMHLPGSTKEVELYRRYRDDTWTIISSDDPREIITVMTVLASAIFPPRIPISFEYARFMMSFLDCCVHIHFPGRVLATYPRLNFSRPSLMVNVSSNSWQNHLYSSYISNTVRAYRICNDITMSRKIQSLMHEELSKAGHSSENIAQYKRKAMEIILRAEYRDLTQMHGDEVHLEEDQELSQYNQTAEGIPIRGFIYPPPVMFDQHSNVFSHVRQMVRGSQQISGLMFKNPPVTPKATLKKILVTKNIYRNIVNCHVMKL